MDLMKMIQDVSLAQTKRFPNGDEPFKAGCRLLEEAGEVVWELNHYERKGISIEKDCKENKEELVAEAYQVCIALNQLLQYFDLTDSFNERIKEVHQEYSDKGYL